MNDLYISYRQRFIVAANGMMFMPKNKEGAVKLTNPYLYKHLTGGYAIGVFAGEKRSKFMCFDVDDGNVESVVAIMSALEVFGINKRFISVSSSGGKGYHIEIFFDELMPTELQRRVYDWTLSKTGLNRREIEFRPTHGQAIKLPLGVHHKTGNVCWFLDQETFEPIESYDFIAHVEKMPAGDFIRIVNDLPV